MAVCFGDKREVRLQDESIEINLPVTKKEGMREGKKSISPRMKHGHANLSSSSMLDPVYSTECTSINNIKSLEPVFGDHLLVHFDMNFPKQEAKQSLRRDGINYTNYYCSLSTILLFIKLLDCEMFVPYMSF